MLDADVEVEHRTGTTALAFWSLLVLGLFLEDDSEEEEEENPSTVVGTVSIITVSIISITMKELNRTRSRCCDFCRWEDTISSVIVAVGMVSTDEDVFFFVRCSIVCIITVRFFFSFGGSSIVYARISLHSFVISFVRSFVISFALALVVVVSCASLVLPFCCSPLFDLRVSEKLLLLVGC